MEIPVNLFLPGAAKSGTSSLFEHLVEHPEINGLWEKEPHLFSRNERFANLKNDLQNHISGISDTGKFLCDASTSYLPSRKALERIKLHCASPKFILILRHPISRIESHYNWLRSLGIEERAFDISISEEKPFSEENHIHGAYNNYVTFSKYGEQVKHLFDLFGKENCLILEFGEMASGMERVLEKCFTFLELPYGEIVDLGASNSTKEIRTYPGWMKKAYSIIPTGIKKRLKFSALKKKVGQKEEKYKLSEKDKKNLTDKLKEDFILQRELFPQVFEKWNIKL